MFQKVSLIRMRVNEHACISCGLCAKTCKKEFQQEGGDIVGLIDDVWAEDTEYIDEAKAIVTDIGYSIVGVSPEEYREKMEAYLSQME